MSAEKLMTLAPDRQIIIDEWTDHLRDNLANQDGGLTDRIPDSCHHEIMEAYQKVISEVESGDFGEMSDDAIEARMIAFENEKRAILLGSQKR